MSAAWDPRLGSCLGLGDWSTSIRSMRIGERQIHLHRVRSSGGVPPPPDPMVVNIVAARVVGAATDAARSGCRGEEEG